MCINFKTLPQVLEMTSPNHNEMRYDIYIYKLPLLFRIVYFKTNKIKKTVAKLIVCEKKFYILHFIVSNGNILLRTCLFLLFAGLE